MSESGYIPGDPWAICDRCGFQVRMSQTKKTWDGLRVCIPDWEPKHPQLTIRGRVDRQMVVDGRPEPAPVYVQDYGFGAFTLKSPNGTNYIVSMADGGTLAVTPGTLGTAALFLLVGNYLITVDNSGNLSANLAIVVGPPAWRMISPDLTAYQVKTTGGVITVALAP
jgi:hypothetical protein